MVARCARVMRCIEYAKCSRERRPVAVRRMVSGLAKVLRLTQGLRIRVHLDFSNNFKYLYLSF